MLEKKFARFVELSSEFCVEPEEYKKASNYLGMTSISGLSNSYMTVNCSDKPSPTKIELYELAMLEKIEKAKRWEEYLTLKSELGDYLKIKLKLEEDEQSN